MFSSQLALHCWGGRYCRQSWTCLAEVAIYWCTPTCPPHLYSVPSQAQWKSSFVSRYKTVISIDRFKWLCFWHVTDVDVEQAWGENWTLTLRKSIQLVGNGRLGLVITIKLGLKTQQYNKLINNFSFIDLHVISVDHNMLLYTILPSNIIVTMFLVMFLNVLVLVSVLGFWVLVLFLLPLVLVMTKKVLSTFTGG